VAVVASGVFSIRRFLFGSAQTLSVAENIEADRIISEGVNADPNVYLSASTRMCHHDDCVRYRATVNELHQAEWGVNFYPPAGMAVPGPPIGMRMLVNEEQPDEVTLTGARTHRFGRNCNHESRFGAVGSRRRNSFRHVVYMTLKAKFPAVVNGRLRKFTKSDLNAMRERALALMTEHGMRAHHIARELAIILPMLQVPNEYEMMSRRLLQSSRAQEPAAVAASEPLYWKRRWFGFSAEPLASGVGEQ